MIQTLLYCRPVVEQNRMRSIDFFQYTDALCIEIGSSHAIIASREKKILLDERATVAIDLRTREPLAIGKETLGMQDVMHGIGVKPVICDGVVTDSEMLSAFLQVAVTKIPRPPLTRLFPRPVCVCVPLQFSLTERRIWERTLRLHGLYPLGFFPEVFGVAASVMPQGRAPLLVIQTGGTAVDVALLGNEEIIASWRVEFGGDMLDAMLQRAIFQRYDVRCALSVFHSIKEELTHGIVLPQWSRVVRGKDRKTGTITSISLTSADILPTMDEYLLLLTQTIRNRLYGLPAEDAALLEQAEVLLSGGLTNLVGLLDTLSSAIEKPVRGVSRPSYAAVFGAASMLGTASFTRICRVPFHLLTR